jgi:hypothetical protein
LLERTGGDQAGYPEQNPTGDVTGIVHTKQDPRGGDRGHQHDDE